MSPDRGRSFTATRCSPSSAATARLSKPIPSRFLVPSSPTSFARPGLPTLRWKGGTRRVPLSPSPAWKHLSRSARGGASEAANAGGNATPPGRALGFRWQSDPCTGSRGQRWQPGWPALHRREAGEGDFGRIVGLLILTGQCREEIGGARRSEIVGSFLRIGADRTKNGLPHDVSLVPAAIKALQTGLDLDDGQTWVFGTGAARLSGLVEGEAKS